MRNLQLTFMTAAFSLLGAGCFLSTEGESYDYSGYDSEGGSSPRCEIGEPGCECTRSGLCNEGLVCREMLNLCEVRGDCSIGERGCECTEGGTCDPGSTCREGLCVSEEPCGPERVGTESCQCTMGGGCSPGLTCLSDVCVLVPDEPETSTTGEGTGSETTSSSTGPSRTSDPDDAGGTDGGSTGGSSSDGPVGDQTSA